MTPPFDIPWAKPDLWGNEQEYVSKALASTWISGGEYVDRLERDFADYAGVPFALTASNGTTALHMAYLALGIGPGDEVIVPGFSFMGAANIALHLRAKPIFSDVDPATWCVTAEEIERRLSTQTKAIVPVHTYGNVCAMDEILDLAAARGIPVIEDAAESLGSRYKGKLSGTMAHIGTYSFHATKVITTGEGGMVVTESQRLQDAMSLYRNHGMLRQKYYWHELPGHNFRLTNLQAALGCAQLEKLDVIIRERMRVHTRYQEALADVDGLTLQHFPPEVDIVLWALALKLEPGAFPQGRDEVMKQMAEAGIETRPGFYPPTAMKSIYDAPELPVCEEISAQTISLPTYPTLTDDQIERISAELIGLRK